MVEVRRTVVVTTVLDVPFPSVYVRVELPIAVLRLTESTPAASLELADPVLSGATVDTPVPREKANTDTADKLDDGTTAPAVSVADTAAESTGAVPNATLDVAVAAAAVSSEDKLTGNAEMGDEYGDSDTVAGQSVT